MSLVAYETYELSKTSEDVFIEMAKYLYDTYGFAKLNEYYIFLKEKKREIVIIFCNLTEFICNEDKAKIEECFYDFLMIKSDIVCKLTEMDDLFDGNPIFWQINNYFKKIKLNDLLYTENDELIISREHKVWIARIRNLSNYYNEIKSLLVIKRPKSNYFGFLGWKSKKSIQQNLFAIEDNQLDTHEDSDDEGYEILPDYEEEDEDEGLLKKFFNNFIDPNYLINP